MNGEASTKEKILQAARKVFAEKGFLKASVESIAREAEVSKSLVFWYFKNKDELIKEVVKDILPGKAVEECLSKNIKGEELVRCFIERYVKLLSDPLNKKLAIHLMGLSLVHPNYKKLYDEFCEEALRELARRLFCREPDEVDMATVRGLNGLVLCNSARGYDKVEVLASIAIPLLKERGLCT
ncbi:TetR family transcriptional regulator [Ignicoccus islandicus DSM 13165]|uniref:TetR family transcriptional regulator n=1 Tax=Ignicoccus islandicus DSM 13165 TaxID=940295 RepID=A0A0U3FZM3_9CREN|nr:TetR/AcrR family transcriptional regulator [Ignicoccus islandicus]ALU11548.1 TetR family transcriptional regulator [Ignicoccus islandicus DSM 13165]